MELSLFSAYYTHPEIPIFETEKSEFVMVDNMEWFNVFGLIFIAVIMIPNVVLI